MRVTYYQSNNDYEPSPCSVAVALSDAHFEMETGLAAFLLLREGLSKEDALKEIDNLRWLVERSFRKTPPASG